MLVQAQCLQSPTLMALTGHKIQQDKFIYNLVRYHSESSNRNYTINYFLLLSIVETDPLMKSPTKESHPIRKEQYNHNSKWFMSPDRIFQLKMLCLGTQAQVMRTRMLTFCANTSMGRFLWGENSSYHSIQAMFRGYMISHMGQGRRWDCEICGRTPTNGINT